MNYPTTLAQMAQEGYAIGLSTIGQVATHIELNYYAYWLIAEVAERTNELRALIAGHEADSIDLYLTPEAKKFIDAQTELAFGELPDGPADEGFP